MSEQRRPTTSAGVVIETLDDTIISKGDDRKSNTTAPFNRYDISAYRIVLLLFCFRMCSALLVLFYRCLPFGLLLLQFVSVFLVCYWCHDF